MPAATTSISISVNGTTPQVFGCTGAVCSGSFLAPAGGSDSFLFNALDGQSRALASGSVNQAIAANGSNAIALTLNGVVDHLTFTIGPGLNSAANGQAAVTATAFDADGDGITGTYAAPIIISTNDTTGTVTGATFGSSTATGAVTYAYSAATAYVDNHLIVTGSSTTMPPIAPIPSAQFVVGRTLYTFNASGIVAFAPGATAPTRTIAIAPALIGVSSLACDGTNLYINDSERGMLTGYAPGATTPTVSYTASDVGPVWVAAFGGGAQPGNRAQVYAPTTVGSPLVEYQGPVSAQPFTIPPNVATNTGGTIGYSALLADGSGNIYAAKGGQNGVTGGYDMFDPTLQTIPHSGTNPNTDAHEGSGQIALDSTVNPPRIYTQDLSSITGEGVVAEYDNFAASPTFISNDNGFAGLFVDPAGRIYTNVAGTFHVYAPGGLAGSSIYSIAGQSLAFDSAGYVYAVNPAGTITEYAPGSTTVVATFTGANYGHPFVGTHAFATFCQ